jgi:hypothetical protein
VDEEPSRGPQPSGLDNPGDVDLVRIPASGLVELVLDAPGTWDGSDHRQILLQEKLNRYLEYVLDGQLVADHPAAAGRGWLVVVETTAALDQRTAVYLERADRELRRSGGGLEVRRL